MTRFLIIIILSFLFSNSSFAADDAKVTYINVKTNKYYSHTGPAMRWYNRKQMGPALWVYEEARKKCVESKLGNLDVCQLYEVYKGKGVTERFEVDSTIAKPVPQTAKSFRKPFSKQKLINAYKNAPPKGSNKYMFYFFAYTSKHRLFYGWAYPIVENGKIKEFKGSANSIQYKTGAPLDYCNVRSRQTNSSIPFRGKFFMECPYDETQNIIGSWSQDRVNLPGLGTGFNKNGDQVSVFFSIDKNTIIKSVNSFNFDGTMEVKKPVPKKEVKKPVPKKEVKKPVPKKIIRAPEVDPKLLTIGSGSGFYINKDGYALTNDHVVSICKQSVAKVEGKEILFRVITTDPINDVAILKTERNSPHFLKINEDGAKLGEEIVAIGYPLASTLSDSVKVTRGIVSSLSGLGNNSGQIQIDAALQPGNSGGPVLNKKGEVVGMASAGLNKLLMAKEAKYIPENVNFAVATPLVRNILKSKNVKYSTPSFFSSEYSNTELANLGNRATLKLLCRNTLTAYKKLKKSEKYTHILLDLE